MPFCNKCGNKMLDGASFCSNCGAPAYNKQPQQTPVQPVTAPTQPVAAPIQPVQPAMQPFNFLFEPIRCDIFPIKNANKEAMKLKGTSSVFLSVKDNALHILRKGSPVKNYFGVVGALLAESLSDYETYMAFTANMIRDMRFEKRGLITAFIIELSDGKLMQVNGSHKEFKDKVVSWWLANR